MAKRLGVAALCSVAVLMGTSVAFGQIKRTVLQQTEVSIPGKEVITARADIPVGSSAGLHTHPGDEISYVLQGDLEVIVEGASKIYKAGEAFHVPAGKVHDAKPSGGGPVVVIVNYVVEKGKPATTPVK